MDKIGDNSLFMMDDSKSDNKEVVIDFCLSWTLRCAARENDKHPLVTKYAKDILSILLDIKDVIEIFEVRTWKQHQRIDLWVEIETNNGKYALLIETKAYSSLHDNQLKRYKDIFEDYYSGSDFNRHYVVVVLNDIIPQAVIEECERIGYKPFSLETIYASLMGVNNDTLTLTGSDLFDEFWFSTWW